MRKSILLYIFVMAAYCVFVMPSSVYAKQNYPSVDVTEHGNLTIVYEGEGTEFRLYRIANIKEDASFEILPAYAAYMPDPIHGLEKNSEEWAETAAKLASRLKEDDAKSDYTVVISDHRAVLNKIPLGLYLLDGNSVTVNQTTYHPIPTFLMVPEYLKGEWVYTFEAEPKKWTETLPTPEPDEKEKYSVVKKWSGDSEEVRPAEITVVIKKDGKIVKTVVLNDSNQWKYIWSDVKGSVYSVAEQSVPEHYSVVISGTEYAFVIINVYQGVPPDSPDTGDSFLRRKLFFMLGVAICAGLATGIALLKDRVQ